MRLLLDTQVALWWDERRVLSRHRSATMRTDREAHMICNRRTFVAAASGLALGTRMAAANAQGANDRIRFAVISPKNRST